MAKRYNYIFESSKPAWLKKREAAERHAKRQAAGRKAVETRRTKQGKQPLPRSTPSASQIKAQIRYINQRIRKYGDPEHLLDLLPPVAKTNHKKGRLSTSAESIAFFSGGQAGSMLSQIQASIHKRDVSNPVREMLEETLGEIYDELKTIGKDRFYDMLGRDLGQSFTDALKDDADTDKKINALAAKWKKAKKKIPEYYDELIRGGKLTAYTDEENRTPHTD